jgi:hypothetical protein
MAHCTGFLTESEVIVNVETLTDVETDCSSEILSMVSVFRDLVLGAVLGLSSSFVAFDLRLTVEVAVEPFAGFDSALIESLERRSTGAFVFVEDRVTRFLDSKVESDSAALRFLGGIVENATCTLEEVRRGPEDLENLNTLTNSECRRRITP